MTTRSRLRAAVLLALAAGLAGLSQGSSQAPCPPAAAASYDEAYRTLRVGAGVWARFGSIQEAVDSVVAGTCRLRTEILIAPGRYSGPIVIPPGAPPLTLRGQGASPSEVVLTAQLRSLGENPLARQTAADSSGPEHGRASAGAATLRVDSGDHIFSNLAIANTRVRVWEESGFRTLAARVDGDRVAFSDVFFVNWGSDLLGAVAGRQYYHRCLFDARDKGTDFVFGSARAVFERCRIRIAQSDSQVVAHGRGHIAQPWPRGYPGGFVFRACRIETGPGADPLLGRSWNGGGRIVFLKSWLGAGIRTEGWSAKGIEGLERTVFFGEFDSRGPGAAASGRVPWARQLDAEGAREFSTRRFLRDASGVVDPWLEYVLGLGT